MFHSLFEHQAGVDLVGEDKGVGVGVDLAETIGLYRRENVPHRVVRIDDDGRFKAGTRLAFNVVEIVLPLALLPEQPGGGDLLVRGGREGLTKW